MCIHKNYSGEWKTYWRNKSGGKEDSEEADALVQVGPVCCPGEAVNVNEKM